MRGRCRDAGARIKDGMIIRDPVHGDIALTSLEREVLDTPEVQRLRGIKQTGTANLVYPGCVHTRFDHSLGTLAMVRRIARGLRERGHDLDRDEEQAAAVAALIHDVTHVPFGHTLEDERRLFPRHDRGDRLARLLDGRLGETLRRAGLFAPVVAILEEKAAEREGPGARPLWPRQVVSSTIDADLLDYLRRDSYFAGLVHDYDERIFHYFDLDAGRLVLNLVRDEMDRPDARSEVLQLLRTRYFLSERVYFHHTKVCSGAIISKAVELATEHGLREEDLLWQSDYGLLGLLKAYPPGRPDPRVRRLAERVERRELLKRGYVISAARVDREARSRLVAAYHFDREGRRRAEEELARCLGLPFEDVVVYCPALSFMKEAGALVRTRRGVVHLNDPSAGAPSELRALEERYEALWRFYVFVPEGHEERCARAAEELFGFPSERRARG